jgi:phosphatidylinositol-3-phosphatase
VRSALAAAALLALLVVPGAARARGGVPPLRHVVVIVFENKERDSVFGNPDAPTFNRLAQQFATLSRYYGVAHPSLPNYLALVSGSTHGIRSDCTSCLVGGRSLAGTLAAAHRTWKTYAEGLPRPGFAGASAGAYAKKHNPFLYFREVVDRPAWRARVVPLTALRTDLHRNRLPDFALVVPDLCHSMHDCAVAAGDRWLASVIPPLLQFADTAVFVVFDEGATSARGGGHTFALAAGTAVRRASHYDGVTGHCGLLRTIEDAWRLPRLGCSARAAPITGIWP